MFVKKFRFVVNGIKVSDSLSPTGIFWWIGDFIAANTTIAIDSIDSIVDNLVFDAHGILYAGTVWVGLNKLDFTPTNVGTTLGVVDDFVDTLPVYKIPFIATL